MKLNEAKQLFEDIVELCHQTENQQLIELAAQLYPEVEEATDVTKIKASAEELQVTLHETEFLPEEEDSVQEMHEKIELLSE